MPKNKQTTRTKRRVKKALQRARDPEVAMEALEEIVPEIQKEVETKVEGRVPGQKIGGNKTPWTEADLNEKFPIVPFTPMETIPITWNGVRYQCFAGHEMHVPSVIKEIYDRYIKNKSREKVAPDGITVWRGAGGLQET